MTEHEPSTRAPFQVLVLPFSTTQGQFPRYCLFRRKDAGYWQPIAGGGETGESAADAARRESEEEGGIDPKEEMFQLETISTIPVVDVRGFLWGNEILLLKEYCFAVKVSAGKLTISDEHTEFKWASYEDAMSMLKWDSNRTALWELNYRLLNIPDTLLAV